MNTDLKQLRKELGYSQTEAYTVCGVPRRTWQDWEDGRNRVPEIAVRVLIWHHTLKMCLDSLAQQPAIAARFFAEETEAIETALKTEAKE